MYSARHRAPRWRANPIRSLCPGPVYRLRAVRTARAVRRGAAHEAIRLGRHRLREVPFWARRRDFEPSGMSEKLLRAVAAAFGNDRNLRIPAGRSRRKPAIADCGSGRRRWPSFVSERQWPLIHDPPQAISPPIDQRYGKRVSPADFFCRQATRATPACARLPRACPRLPAPRSLRRATGAEIPVLDQAVAAQSAVLPPGVRPAPATRHERHRAS